MSAIIPYLNFDGDCEAAFLFYQSVLGGEIPHIGRFGEIPPSEHYKVAQDDSDKIMHMSLISDSGLHILGSDVPGSFKDQYNMGNNISLSLTAESREDAKRLFHGLSDGGRVTMPLEDTFWGAYFGMWTDKFGVNWMVNYDDPSKAQPH